MTFYEGFPDKEVKKAQQPIPKMFFFGVAGVFDEPRVAGCRAGQRLLTSRCPSVNAQALRQNSEAPVVIEGHCDERGTVEYNLALGDKRAKAVKDYLVWLGIDSSRLATVSYGKERPADLGHHEAAWAQNRRAEFVIKTQPSFSDSF